MSTAHDVALWRAATALRDRLPPAEARDLLLSLVALRALDAAPDRPAEAAWARVRSADQLDAALAAWRRARPELGQALRAAPAVEPRRLLGAIEAVHALDRAVGEDLFGELYTVLLGRFARAEGRRGGQYFTPPDVAALLVAITAPIAGVVYDPACGSGGLLLAAARAATGPTRLVGQELNPSTWRLGHLGAAVAGVRIELGRAPADTLHHDLHPDLRADIVLANPPFNLAGWGVPASRSDPRWALGPPPDTTANLAWLQHALYHLAPGGRGAVVLANGSLTERRPAERELRRALLRSGRIEAIVALPDRLFWTTAIPACVWVLGEARRDRVLLVDARELGPEPVRGARALPASARAAIAGLIDRARADDDVVEPGVARRVSIDELTTGSVRLDPGARVGIGPRAASPQVDPPSIAELRALADRARELDEALLDALAALEASA